MSNEIDLSKVPAGSTIATYDYSKEFMQRIERAMNGRTDLYILYLRRSTARPQPTKGYVVMSNEEALERRRISWEQCDMARRKSRHERR
jgi:hypothetical protein